jgi:quercetin dioxygenase-like cupin family protein
MRNLKRALGLLLLFSLLWGGWALAQTAAKKEHKMVTPDQVTWGKPPPGVPTNIEAAILDGDPAKPGTYVARLKFPDGARIAPHWHTKDEDLTVLSGRFRMGTGDSFNEASLKDLPPGSYISLPGKQRHFAVSKGETIVQLNNQGPFDIHYVDPRDDPREKRATSR